MPNFRHPRSPDEIDSHRTTRFTGEAARGKNTATSIYPTHANRCRLVGMPVAHFTHGGEINAARSCLHPGAELNCWIVEYTPLAPPRIFGGYIF